jgi:hypothetical protein
MSRDFDLVKVMNQQFPEQWRRIKLEIRMRNGR